LLTQSIYSVIKTKDISIFQENNFDLCFLIDKTIKIKHIKLAIEKTNPKIITKVELIDIYKDEVKLK
jgi:phenylalanyl-tRNA synthetase beta subunit